MSMSLDEAVEASPIARAELIEIIKERDALKAELAAMKARRCENCAHYFNNHECHENDVMAALGRDGNVAQILTMPSHSCAAHQERKP